jgi:uncharacterized protein YdaU (DUF1376 family)
MSLQYYRFFPGDYARDTRHLSMMQHGAYRQLIDEYMVHGPLPNDLQRLYRICSAFSAEERAAVEFILSEFFLLCGPHWVQRRCDRERAWQEGRSEAAKEAINKRWLYGRNTDVQPTKYRGNTNQNQNQNQNQIPDPKPKPEIPTLPTWLGLEAWTGYLNHRRDKRAKMSAHAQKLALQKLAELRDKGHDPQKVIEQSIANGWTGLFPISNDRASKPRAADTLREWVNSHEREDLPYAKRG